MVINRFGITYEQPSFEQIGNVFFRAPESRANIERLMRERGVNGLIEPNVGQTAVMLEVNSQKVAEALNPWNAAYVKCDALHVDVSFLKRYNYALFARSADCMMLSLLSEKDVYLFHLSVESINNGILKILEGENIGQEYLAIEGPCISAKEYYLYGEEYIRKKTSNFEEFGYMDRTYLDDKGLHVDIRAIARDTLKKCGVSEIVEDNRCTFLDTSLGSNRRQGVSRHDNVIIIK